MDLGLVGAAAVVTGGSKGMGLAIAETLAADGARVAVMARGREALDAATESLLAAGAPDAVGISVDMTDPNSIAAGFDEVWDAVRGSMGDAEERALGRDQSNTSALLSRFLVGRRLPGKNW